MLSDGYKKTSSGILIILGLDRLQYVLDKYKDFLTRALSSHDRASRPRSARVGRSLRL
jgi:hypothetical protein